MPSIVVSGNKDYCDWIEKILTVREIACVRDKDCEKVAMVIDGDEVDIGFLYEIDLFPRLMYIYNNMSEDISLSEGMVLGCSFGRDSISAEKLSKKFVMLANSAQDFYYDSCCYSEYEKKIKKLKYMIHAWATFSLRYDESLSRKKKDNVLFYYTMYGKLHNCSYVDAEINKYAIEKNKFDNLLSDYITWDELRKELWNSFFSYSNWSDPILIDTCFDREHIPQVEIDMALAQNNKPYPMTIKENIEIITGLYDEFKKKGIKTLIFMQPMNDIYRKYWDEQHYYEVLNFAKYISEKYQCDLLDLTMTNLPDNYYRDMIHLNNRGKEYITDVIDEIISSYE